MGTSSSRIISLKLLFISVTVVSAAVTMKSAVPFMLNSLPAIWSVIVTWLKPPYLYFVINGIIIIIAASTSFQHNHHQENQSQSQEQVDYTTPNVSDPSDLVNELPPVSIPQSFGVMEPPPVTYDIYPDVTVEPPVVYESKKSDIDLEKVAVSGENEDEFGTSSQSVIDSPTLRQQVQPEFNFPVIEKELVTSRFANNRKPIKSSPEGARALRVLKPKKHETLETTWKMINDGRQLPLTRHFRNPDTFDNCDDRLSDESTAKSKVVRKPETFKDRKAYANQNDYPSPSPENSSPATVGKLKKEASLSQDELNRRAEAFIKKFNDDMRLQRQESLKQYMEMVNGGTRL